MTFDEIVEIGRKEKPNADTVVEYKNGYVFSSEEDKGYDGGLGHSAVVVLKDGTVTDMISFINQGTGKEKGIIKIGTGGGFMETDELNDESKNTKLDIDEYKDRLTSPVVGIRIDPETGKPI